MNARRTILALLLLCTYSLSFAQGLLPHSHEWQNGIGNEEHHHYGALDKDQSDAHSTCGKEWSEDRNVMDILLCFLTDLDNPDDVLNSEASSLTVKTLKLFQQAHLLAVVLSFIPNTESSKQVHVPHSVALCQSLLSKSISLRGPPSIS